MPEFLPPSHASWYSGTDLTHRLCRGCLACASKHKMRALLDLISQLRERTVPSWGGPRRHDNDGRLPTYSIITFDFGGASVAMVPYPLASFFCDSRQKRLKKSCAAHTSILSLNSLPNCQIHLSLTLGRPISSKTHCSFLGPTLFSPPL